MAVAGPDRSGSGTGVPVPRSTILVRAGEGMVDSWDTPTIAISIIRSKCADVRQFCICTSKKGPRLGNRRKANDRVSRSQLLLSGVINQTPLGRGICLSEKTSPGTVTAEDVANIRIRFTKSETCYPAFSDLPKIMAYSCVIRRKV